MSPQLRGPRVWLMVLLFPAALFAADPPKSDLQEALRLRHERKFPEAEKILETWLAEYPNDGDALAEYAWVLFIHSAAESDPAVVTALLKKSHESAVKAQKLGSNNIMLPSLLSEIDENGKERPRAFSKNPAANDLIKQGEDAFGKGKYVEAFLFYEKAYQIEPKSYQAANLAGDALFSQKKYAEAIVWFKRASDIDENVETAHRYLGDAYMKIQEPTKALEQYLAAAIAQPYNRYTREMLKRYAKTVFGKELQSPKVTLPVFKVEQQAEKNIEINLDPKTGPSALGYATARAKWLGEDRKKFFSEKSEFRHSLPEEAAGLRAFVTIWGELESKGSTNEVEQWRGTVMELKKLESAGLLEPYILLDRFDKGIAQDYASYRAEHRELLERYMREIWLGLEIKLSP